MSINIEGRIDACKLFDGVFGRILRIKHRMIRLALFESFFFQLFDFGLVEFFVLFGGFDSLLLKPIQKRSSLTFGEWIILWCWFHFVLFFFVGHVKPLHLLVIQPLF